MSMIKQWGGALGLAVICGCGPSETPPEDIRMPSPPVAQPAFTPESLREHMARIEATILAGDGGYLDSLIAADVILSKVYVGAERSPDLVRTFEERAPRHLRVGSQVVEAVKGQGIFRLVKVYEAPDGWHAIFRLVTESGILNYHDYTIRAVRGPDGVRPVIEDVYVYSAGETLTRSMQRMYIAMYVGMERERVSNFEGVDAVYASQLMQLQTIALMVKDGHYEKALKLHLRAPDLLQAEKYMLKQRLLIARHVGRDAYMAALEAARQTFPDDPAWILMELLRFKAEDDRAAFFKEAEAMKKSVGDDPYLGYLQGAALIAQGKEKAAIEMLVQALQKDPLLKPAYWTLLEVHVKRQEYEQAVALLRTVRQQFGVLVTNLKDKEGYQDFLVSEPYQVWLKEIAGSTSGAGSAPQ